MVSTSPELMASSMATEAIATNSSGSPLTPYLPVSPTRVFSIVLPRMASINEEMCLVQATFEYPFSTAHPSSAATPLLFIATAMLGNP